MKPRLILSLLAALAFVSALADNVTDTVDAARPAVVTAAEIFGSKERPSEPWSGFDPARYRDMSFYDKDGVAHLRGRVIDYNLDEGVKTFSVRVNNCLTDAEKVHVGDINPDGTFALDIPVPYPQFDFFRLGKTGLDVFLMPGDTLSLVTTMKKRGIREPVFYGFEGPVDDGVVINVLADSLRKHYDTGELFRRYNVARDDSMKMRVYANNERLALMLDGIVKDLPVMLADVPVSAFAKDVLSVCILGDVCEMMEDLDLSFRHAKGPNVVPDPVEGIKMIPGETLDPDSLLAPRRRHFALMYDNPLMLCRGWILPNRWTFGTLFQPTGMAAEGMLSVGDGFVGTDDISCLVRDDMARLDSLGIDNCFVPQIVRTASLIERINSHTTPSSASLAKNGLLIANVLRHNDYEPMADALMSTYSGMVQDVMIAENRLAGIGDNSIMIDGSAEGDILQKIIAPYRGNVLFLDFWGIGCGPCRSGMIGQKPMLAEYADKPFKALYIANADDGMEACKKWLRKEEIGGEHIFVTGDDWTRLSSLFNFSGIPFGVIIDQDGTVLKTGLHMPMEKQVLDEIMKGK